ncbi:putative hexaprenyl pyrophosphate synthase, mitochondrial [Smittium culicis]|uniref:Putative hexaprenyl pyrophosphate synthase, mitochondrial n=2 Tax=Smittium culicis TaxID=133412 RepID=A0A1R1Y9R4_9FUNG|nr:putative hexaprenyl pyrophosphate synthase, mitochondrial [Smittium culicis]
MSNLRKAASNAIQRFLDYFPDPSKYRPLARFAVENLKISQSIKRNSEALSQNSDNELAYKNDDFLKASIPTSHSDYTKTGFLPTNPQFRTEIGENSLFPHNTHSYIHKKHDLIAEWIKEPVIASTIDLKKPIDSKYDAIKSFEFSIKEASNLVKNDINKVDPFKLVASELGGLTDNISRILETGNPKLSKVVRHYFQATGKQIRPLVVLLMSQVVNGITHNSSSANSEKIDYSVIDKSVPKDIEFDKESSIRDSVIREALSHSLNKNLYNPTTNSNGSIVLPTQRRLAEITELIHTASLVHDDIIDGSDTRRGIPTSHQVFGNKMSVLAGDFLLARASVSLARLRNPEVVELLATVIMDLVEGEFKQLKNINTENGDVTYSNLNSPNEESFNYYLQKTYLKTSSLFAKSIRASAILGNAPDHLVEMAFVFGRNLGTAFQLVDDLLDFTSSKKQTGKPVGADLNLGIATAPVLYAWQEFPELGELIKRKFSNENDAETAYKLVINSQGLQKTRLLVEAYAEKAMASLSLFPPSQSRQALLNLTHSLIFRTK